MRATTIQVESKIMDGNPQLTKLDPMILHIIETRITVEDLIRRVVEEQVSDLLSRRRVDAAEAKRILNRQYLTQDQVEDQARHGTVRMPRKTRTSLGIDIEVEVRKAIHSFADGACYIFINGRQVISLREELTIAETAKVTFLRLTPLVGG